MLTKPCPAFDRLIEAANGDAMLVYEAYDKLNGESEEVMRKYIEEKQWPHNEAIDAILEKM